MKAFWKNTFLIFKRENLFLKRSFGAYFFIAAFNFAFVLLGLFIGKALETQQASLSGFFAFCPTILALLIPILASMQWEEEKKDGTLNLLFSMPIKSMELVFGKFLAYLLVVIWAHLVSLLFAFAFLTLGSFDIGIVAASYLGSIFFGAILLALNAFISSTKLNIWIGLILNIGVNYFLISIYPIMGGDTFGFDSFLLIFDDFLRGQLKISNLILMVSLIGVLLFLASENIKNKRAVNL